MARATTPDPGWGGRRTFAIALIPILGAQIAKRADHGLVALRLIFLSFCSAIVVIGVVVLLIGTDDATEPAIGLGPAIAIVALIGIAAIVAADRVRRLDCSSEAALSTSYRTRLFVRLALGEASALVGFVFLFLADSVLPYFVGAAFTAVVFVRIAPTRARVVADRAALRGRKCDLDLVAVLATPPA